MMCAPVSVEARGRHGAAAILLSSIFLEDSLSLNLEHAITARLAGQQAVRTRLSSSSSAEVKGTYGCAWVLCRCWGVLVFMQQLLLTTEPSSRSNL